MDPKANQKKDLVTNIKEDERFEYEEDKNDFNNSNNNNDILREKMMKLIFIIAIVAVVIFVLLMLLSSIIGKNKSYSQIENIMNSAAKKYYNANSSLLPKVNGSTVEVSAKKLINLNYMSDFSKYKKNASCNGKVVVENNDDDYIYVSYLDCGESYKTTELYRKITDRKNIVTGGNGLYYNNGIYYYRGDKVNNYVAINDMLWRIVEVNKDNQLMLIKQDKVSSNSVVWDDRYNSTREENSGINDFNVSRVKEYLDSLYDYVDPDKGGATLFDDNIKGHIVSHKFCYGKRETGDVTKDNSSECQLKTEDMKIGLLTASEYMRVSLDASCSKTTSKECQNYNYLANSGDYNGVNWWLITASLKNTYRVYYVSFNGAIELTSAENEKKIRPVIYLNSRTMYDSGDGTLEDPYVIK